jgi:hypothetical protein
MHPFFVFPQKPTGKTIIKIMYSPGHPVNTFVPSETLGAAFDGHERGEINKILLPENIKAMRSSGYGPLTYRLRTELANEVWHWNPAGHWSDEKNKQGYWISSSDTNNNISMSYSYRLPRRGNTYDQGDNDGYSRIDDGDEKTFWKSNPYLDEYYSDSKKEIHPQWVVIDLGKEEYINAIKIKWAQPYATSFTIDYADPSIYQYFIHFGYYETNDTGLWKSFQHELFSNQNGSDNILLLSDRPTKARFIRIRMIESSHTAIPGSIDIRDSLGFAIREIYIGKINSKKVFKDFVHHYTNNSIQSKIYVSSTDCWHRAIDINKQTEQAGIDRIYQCGLTNNMPALIPVGVLYDTPENALALVEYLEKKHYLVDGIEMGEEADGQFIAPEDYAAIYTQWSKKIKQIYPDLKLGGPSLETVIIKWPDELFSTQTWLHSFYKYLETHNAANNFNFLSFEWYPYDNICDNAAQQLADAAGFMDTAMNDLYETKLPRNIPLYISEYGYSAFSGRSEVSIEGALMNADIVGKFLSLGGNKAFLYGLEPNQLEENSNCSSYGNNMLFGRDDNGKILYKTATYFGLKMLTDFWAAPSKTPISMYLTSDNVINKKISSYALLSADDTWSVLLINKDPLKKFDVHLDVFNYETKGETPFKFPAIIYQYSTAQYKWKEDGINGHPVLDLPPKPKKVNSLNSIQLPPYSLTVVKQLKVK